MPETRGSAAQRRVSRDTHSGSHQGEVGRSSAHSGGDTQGESIDVINTDIDSDNGARKREVTSGIQPGEAAVRSGTGGGSTRGREAQSSDVGSIDCDASGQSHVQSNYP